MKTLEIKNLANEFKENLKINHDIKKKNWFKPLHMNKKEEKIPLINRRGM